MAAVFKLVCMVLALMVVAAPYAAEGASICDTIRSKMQPCFSYLAGGALDPTCCPGIKSLVTMAPTTSERRAACECVKYAATLMNKDQMAKAATLPQKCNVRIPYMISSQTDCSKVQ